MKNIFVLIGAGSIGVAIACRISAGKHVLLADLHEAPVAQVRPTKSPRSLLS